MEDTKKLIEINGIKLEVDLRYAKKIENFRIGSNIKCLVKRYENYKVCPGVIIGFDNFEKLPTINIIYLDQEYGQAKLEFKAFNAESKDFEICESTAESDIDINRDYVLDIMDRDIASKELALLEATNKRDFFIKNFNKFFKNDK